MARYKTKKSIFCSKIVAELQRIITIGASMGGLAAISQLVKSLPDDLPAAVFIVQHMSANSIPQLPFLLSKITSLKVKLAEDGESIQAGTIYVSVNDKHLIVEQNKIVLGDGIMENRSRPSINNLFRSAAAAYKQRTIGILMTGYLYDGANGLEAIKELGGVTIVQDPAEAEYDQMPLNAIKNAEIDYIVPVDKMASLLKELVNKEVDDGDYNVSTTILKQIEIASRKITSESEHSIIHEFRTNSVSIDDSLVSILQIMQERSIMLENMAESELLKENKHMARIYFNRASECRLHTENLKKHLQQRMVKAS